MHPAKLFEFVMSVVWSLQKLVQRTFGTTVSIADSVSEVSSVRMSGTEDKFRYKSSSFMCFVSSRLVM